MNSVHAENTQYAGQETMHRLDAIMSQPAGSHAGEYKVLKFRRHARHLLWSVLVLIAISAAVPFFAGSFLEPWQNWAVLGGGGLAALLCVIMPFFSWLARTTTISTRRIIVRSGVFTRHRSEIALAHIRELKLKRGLLQRIFGAGDIVLQSGAGDPHVLINVPKVKITAQAIQELIEWHYSSQQFVQQQAGAYGFASQNFASQ